MSLSTVNESGIFLGGKDKYFAKCVGYSPTPPGKGFDTPPNGDFYTSKYKFLYDRDIYLFEKLGINTIRLWNWDLLADHTDFLDKLWDRNIRVIVPFIMNKKIYPDLKNIKIRRLALANFGAFLQYQSHPAIFAYAIGNELNREYQTTLPELFSLVNQMAMISQKYHRKKYKSIQVESGLSDQLLHPVTVPLSDDGSFKDLIQEFNRPFNISFWSLQTYRKDPYDFWSNVWLPFEQIVTGKHQKPLLISEFGADSYPLHKEPGGEYHNQTEIIEGMWKVIDGVYNHTIRDSWVSLGGCLMEWSDEWCKGTFPDISHPGPCPSYQYKKQSPCSHNVSNQIIYEEYMGAVRLYDIVDGQFYCIEPKPSYFALRQIWGNTSDPFPQRPCAGTIFEKRVKVGDTYVYLCCGRRQELEILLIAAAVVAFLCLLPLGFLIAKNLCGTCCLFCRKPEIHESSSFKQRKDIGADLRALLRDAFSIFSNTKIAKERLYRLIMDELDLCPSANSKNLTRAIRIVYEKYFEGYYVWKGEFMEFKDRGKQQYLRELALYFMVGQNAGTMNHSPEKVMEVFEFFKTGFLSGDKTLFSQEPKTPDAIDEYMKDIFRYYYFLFQKRQMTFDDINEDAFRKKNFRLFRFWEWKPFLSCPCFRIEGDPYEDDGYEISEAAQDFLNWKEKFNPKILTFWFPQRGGILTLLYNYGWYIRLNLYMLLIVWSIKMRTSKELCLNSVLRNCVMWDASLGLILWFIHFWVVGIQHTEIHHLVVAGPFWIATAIVIPVMRESLPAVVLQLDFIGLNDVLELVLILYILLRVLKMTFHELILFFVKSPSGMRGRLGRKGWFHLPQHIGDKVIYLLSNSIFWACILAFNGWLFWIFEAILNLTFSNCTCSDDPEHLNSPDYAKDCDLVLISCYAGVIFTWLSTILIVAVVNNIIFQVGLLVAGVLTGTFRRVGNVKTWYDVVLYFDSIVSKRLEVLSGACKEDDSATDRIWTSIVDDLVSDDLLSEEEALNYKHRHLATPPRNLEAKRRLINFLWSLESMNHYKNKHARRSGMRNPFLWNHRVRTMPSWTCLVPVYSETIVYSANELKRPNRLQIEKSQMLIKKKDGIARRIENRQRISTLEYLVGCFNDEWMNFVTKKLAPILHTDDPVLIVRDFLEDRIKSKRAIEEIRFWCSFRGQTLAKTVKGLHRYRQALILLAEIEEWNQQGTIESIEEYREYIRKLVDRKMQIVITHQRFSDALKGNRKDWLEAMKILRKRFPFFDLAYNDENDKDKRYNSVLIPNTRFHYFHSLSKKERKPREIVIKRPGKLKLGEGKAENQMHAINFVLHQIIQVNDMNQDNTLEDSLKVPFTLSTVFNPPTDMLHCDEDDYHPEEVICKYRVLGFPEHCYTRPLSKVGEFMGSAEWTFVTITQRVLTMLQVRAHYGHPDFFDGNWVRTRGGPSKGSIKVNINEDIFSGYEMFCRGEKVTYVDFLEQQKGRESEFFGSYTFESKLAMGAAQQVKSREIYILNKNLQCFKRLSLFHGTLGFYITNTLMALSIDLYMYAIIMFQVGGLSYNKLGLLGSKLAVPYLVQVGFLQAIPMLIEMILQMGFLEGLLYFIKNLPFSFVFFIFHLKTKCFYFMKGLLTGSGSYLGTGRTFGLKSVGYIDMYQRYAESHFYDAIILIGSICAYSAVTEDSFATALVRTSSVLGAAICWLFAPMFFNPFPNKVDAQTDRSDMSRWIASAFVFTPREMTEYQEFKSGDEQKSWWNLKAKDSWESWLYFTMIWELTNIDQLRISERVVLAFSSLVRFVMKYSPWILLTLHLYNDKALAVLVAGVLIVGISFLVTLIGKNNHNLFGILTLPTLFIPVYLIIFYSFEGISFTELFVSILLFLIAIYGVNEIIVEVYLGLIDLQFWLNSPRKRKRKMGRGSERVLSIQVDAPLLGKKKKNKWERRVKTPTILFALQKIYPLLMYVWFVVIGFILNLFGDTITEIMFNARVAASWRKDLWFQIRSKKGRDNRRNGPDEDDDDDDNGAGDKSKDKGKEKGEGTDALRTSRAPLKSTYNSRRSHFGLSPLRGGTDNSMEEDDTSLELNNFSVLNSPPDDETVVPLL